VARGPLLGPAVEQAAEHVEVAEGEGPWADGRQLRQVRLGVRINPQGQRRRLVRPQKLMQLRYQIGAGGPSEAAHVRRE